MTFVDVEYNRDVSIVLNEQAPVLDLKGLHEPLLIYHGHVEQLAKLALGDIDIFGVILSLDVGHIQSNDNIRLLRLKSDKQQQNASKVSNSSPPAETWLRGRSFAWCYNGREFIRRSITIET